MHANCCFSGDVDTAILSVVSQCGIVLHVVLRARPVIVGSSAAKVSASVSDTPVFFSLPLLKSVCPC